MKRKRKAVVASLLVIFQIVVLVLVFSHFSLGEDCKLIMNIIDKKYSSYNVEDLRLEYVDLSSTVRIADDSNRATRATAIVANEDEELTLRFKKNRFNIWYIIDSAPNSGPNVPNDIYFIDAEQKDVSNTVDIDEYLKSYWAIPDEDGNLYTKTDDGDDWHYSFKECENIYKTKDGSVWQFNKDISKWEASLCVYADLCYYNNYDEVSKEYVEGLIKNFSK